MSQWAEQMLAEQHGEFVGCGWVNFEDQRGLQQHDAPGRLVAVGTVCELAFPSQNRSVSCSFRPAKPETCGGRPSRRQPIVSRPTAGRARSANIRSRLISSDPPPKHQPVRPRSCSVRPDTFRTDIEWVFSYTAQGPGMQSVVCRIHERLKLREP